MMIIICHVLDVETYRPLPNCIGNSGPRVCIVRSHGPSTAKEIRWTWSMWSYEFNCSKIEDRNTIPHVQSIHAWVMHPSIAQSFLYHASLLQWPAQLAATIYVAKLPQCALFCQHIMLIARSHLNYFAQNFAGMNSTGPCL